MKILLLYYYPGAGGKYVANLLAHSHSVAFNDNKIARDIVKDPAHVVSACLATIPDDKDLSRDWIKYENGCNKLFGPGIMYIKLNDSDQLYRQQGSWLDVTDLNQWLPVIAHTSSALKRLQKFFNEHEIFTVFVNTDQAFIDCAIKLKWPSSEHRLNLSDYQEFITDSAGINFDYELQWDPRDPTQYSKITHLAQSIGAAWDPETAREYIQKYIDFHHGYALATDSNTI
jgi:hypothetical protein